MLTVDDLNFKYRGDSLVLKNISFQVEDGSFTAILGNNGAGKSTLLKCFNKILRPQSGKIYLDNINILDLPVHELAKNIAFVAQNVPCMQMSVRDVVMLGRKPYMKWGISKEDRKIVDDVLEQLNLIGLQERYLNQLSGGERQKVMLARALAQQPKVLLLDEPTSALDIQNQYQVLQIVKDICKLQSITAIIVIHDLNLALRFCDYFVLLRKCKVYRSGMLNTINRKVLKDVYKIDAEVVHIKNHNIVLVD